jgi:NADH-quinone oxidoreductase subunit N
MVTGIFLVRGLLRHPRPDRDYVIALALSAGTVVVCFSSVRLEGDLFNGAYRVDLFAQVVKLLLAMGCFLVVAICDDLSGIDPRYHPEFYMLLTLCTLALMMLVSAVHLLTIYIALELSSYTLYVLVFLRRERHQGFRAALKYFITGAAASAMMIFGIALLYSAVETPYLSELVQRLPELWHRPAASIGLLLALSGFFFKLAVFPFHFWAPDVYEGAAHQVAAFIATASKVAGVAVLARVIASSVADTTYLVHALVVLAIISMTVGNLTAIVQQDLKRLLAYSSIAHAGYMLIGVLSMNAAGFASIIFYAAALLVMKFTCFLVVVRTADDGHNITVTQLAGLHQRSPLLAMALMLSLFGLAGIPPTIGFTGKLLIFTAAMQQGYFMLVLIAMINVLISLYYYLLVIKAAYLVEPEKALPALNVTLPMKLLTLVMIAVILVAGIYPHYLIELARSAAGVLL